MEAGRHIRPHEKAAIADTAERAKRLAPRIREYGGLAVDCADGVVRLALPETSRHYGGRLAALGAEHTNLEFSGFRMSQTDGVPVPTDHFLDEEPPYGDPL